MAASVSNMLSIDPMKNGKHPVTISDQLRSRSEARETNYTSVQFNHRPKLSTSPKKTTITPSRRSANTYSLTISAENGGNDYVYHGSQKPSSACALVYDPASQTLTLDKISTDFSFNLRATPTNKNPQTLATQYSQLETNVSSNSNSDAEDLFNDDLTAAAQTGDTENPYDYRHFLRKRRRTSSPSPPPSLSATITTTRPTPSKATAPAPKRGPRPANPKQKLKPRPARPQKRVPSPQPAREEADADNEDSDPDVLTIEIDEPETKSRGRFMGAFSHDKRNGPISLRSAASSVSPAGVRLPDHTNDHQSEPEEEESDEDEEMEELLLPSPRGAGEDADGGENVAIPDEGDEMEDGDDDLAREFEELVGEGQADEEGDGGGVGLGVVGAGIDVGVGRRVEESSSESEEE